MNNVILKVALYWGAEDEMEKPNGENNSMNNVVMLMASPFVLLSLMSICLGVVTVIASKYFYTSPNPLQDLIDSVYIGVWLVLMAVVPVIVVAPLIAVAPVMVVFVLLTATLLLFVVFARRALVPSTISSLPVPLPL